VLESGTTKTVLNLEWYHEDSVKEWCTKIVLKEWYHEDCVKGGTTKTVLKSDITKTVLRVVLRRLC